VELNSSFDGVRSRIFTDDVDNGFAQHLIAAPPGLNSSINSVRFRIFTDDVDNGFAQHLIAVPSGLNSSINSVRFRIFIDDVDGLLHPNIAPYLSAVPPVADCGADKVKCENVGSPVQFDGSSSSGSIISYTWNFGDSTNGTGVAPKHTYLTYRWNGTAYKPYTVNLTVTDNGGLTNMTSAFVTIWITGDANGDGKVNIMDASVIGLKWNTADACADLNNDGKVNIIDASIIGLNWGKVA
jgi:hypothetical protein